MTYHGTLITHLPPEQRAIRDKCFHPSRTFVEFPKQEVEQSIPKRFEKIAETYAGRLAVKSKELSVTYREINQTANQLGYAILEQCRKGEGLIALLLGKSPRAIGAILGVLKAGKMYLTLDPAFPKEHIAFMLQDSQAEVIVTDSENLPSARILAGNTQKILNVDDVNISGRADNLRISILPDAFAYIRYTSGSSGQPKGVIENHRNMLHNVMNITNALHICPEDRSTLVGSLSTGQVTTDMYGALLNGASLHLWNTRSEGFVGMAEWIIAEGITIYRASATTFRSFVDTLSGEKQFPKLRIIKLGSEPVLQKDFESYKRYFSQDCVMVNALSLGEARTVCLNVLGRDSTIRGNYVPVGYALPDKEISIRDESGKQVGFNEIGEITVRSAYLSPGYWNKPDLTQAKFLPALDCSYKRTYFTGDLGRVLPDGCLEHVGRKDFQVKVRGYRVELEEVETVVQRHPFIRETAVVAKVGESNDARLIAFIVLYPDHALSITELRRFLEPQLPEYMIPSAFVFLDALPLSPNGKVDRRALPEPGTSRPEIETPYTAPRTRVEKQLAQIWAEVLAVDQVGIHDSFFDLGGHSLLAMRIISKVTDTLQVEISMRSLLDAPTVAGMARLVIESRRQKFGKEHLDRILTELESLSDTETERRLLDQSRTSNTKD